MCVMAREAHARPLDRARDLRGADPQAGRPRLPWGIALFLGYAFLILVGVALVLPTVIDLAIDTPVSFVGLSPNVRARRSARATFCSVDGPPLQPDPDRCPVAARAG